MAWGSGAFWRHARLRQYHCPNARRRFFGAKLPLLLQTGALQLGAARINGIRTLLDIAHNSIFIHDESGAQRNASFFVEDSVLRADRLAEIAEQGKRQAEVFRKALIAGSRVHADSQDLSIGVVEMCDISLISF